MPFKKILLPVDGSKHSENATQHAIHLARLEGATIKVITCYESPGMLPELPDELLEEFRMQAVLRAKERLASYSEALEAAGVEYKASALEGEPGKVIGEMAQSKEYDLVIMGSHGHSDIAGLFLGSVTHKVINTIYCPIMIVP